MKPRCQDEVEAHLGRPATKAELGKIEDDIAYHFRQTQAEAAANGWSTADALREAAIRAEAEFRAEHAKKVQRTALQVDSVAKKQERYNELKTVWGPTKALGRMLEQSDSYIKGIKATAFARIVDAIEAAEPRFLKMVDNPGATRDFVREVFGVSTENATAKRGAAAWLKGVEELRLRANRAGFNIGKLDYGYVPQPHDVGAMERAGKPAWVDAILPKLRRDRYLNDDGTRMTDNDLAPVLGRIFDTVTTNGWNKVDPTAYQGAGSRANRGSAHRELHFAGPDQYLDYMRDFGRGNLWDAMKQHVDGTASSIGLVEEYGPNPQRHFDILDRQSQKDSGGSARAWGFWRVRPVHQWADLSGQSSMSVNRRLAEISQQLRDIQVASKLGGVFLGVGNDGVTLATTALFNNMPAMRTMADVLGTLGADQKRFAAEAGLAVESIIGDMHAFSSENMFGQGWTSKLANANMKASLIEGWTQALRRGFSVSMMHMLADLSKIDWADLAPADRDRFVRRGGVTEADWKIWQVAPKQDWGGSKVLQHDDIVAMAQGGDDATLRAHDHAASVLLGYISKEADAALVIPDNYTRAAMIRGLQKGTAEGEVARHMVLFKGYTFALAHQFLERIAELDMNKAGKVGLGVVFLSAMTMMGALGTQLKQIIYGKDPIDMFGPHAGKFWAQAAFQGGGTSIMGDLVNQITSAGEPAQQASGVASVLLGPTIGSGIDLATATLGEAGKKARGEKTDAGAKLLQFGRYNTPIGAPLNLWYTRAAVDHMFFHELQDEASPGYLNRMQQRAQKNYGQAYWWKPGQGEPQRPPDIARAVQ